MCFIIMDEFAKQYLPIIITTLLLFWSEYLGVTPRYKSNAIIEMLMCALTKKDQPSPEDPPPAVISLPPAGQSPPSQ